MTPEELHDVVGNMKGVNPHAKIIVTQNSKVDLKEVLGIGSFSIERSLEMVRALSSFFFVFSFLYHHPFVYARFSGQPAHPCSCVGPVAGGRDDGRRG